MTDYSTYTWPSSSLDSGHYKKNKRHLFNEEHQKTYELLGSDKVLQGYFKNINKYRPRTAAKDPSTFAYYGKAEQYYKDSVSTILDYYPFDGSRSELFSWYQSASTLDVALLHQQWPSTVGHINFSDGEYVLAYAGPESIPEAEYVGNYKNEFNGLKIDLHEGLTIEFWVKSPAVTYPDDALMCFFEIGTFPGKMPNAQDPSNISASDENLVSTTFALIPSGVRLRLFRAPGNDTVTSSSLRQLFLSITAVNATGTSRANATLYPPNVDVFDNSWHHIAIRLKHRTINEVVCDWFIDGKLEKSQEETVDFQPANTDFDSNFPNSGFGPYNKFMAASLGNSLFRASKSLPGNFPVSLDSFRVWQGERSNKEINRYYDQKVFASEFDPEVPMSSALGLNLTFNESTIGDANKDKIVLDYSGNDITGVIYNYSESARVSTSAIDLSEVSTNTEPKDPILRKEHAEVKNLEEELMEIGSSYDRQNFNLLRNYLPDWTHSEVFGRESKEEMDFLLHLMATAFDSIKTNLDAMRKLTRPEYEQASIQVGLLSPTDQEVEDQSIMGINTATTIAPVPAQNKIDFSKKLLSNYGFDSPEFDLFWTLNSQEVIESLIGNVRLGNTIEETKSLIFDCLSNAAAFVLNKKGTKTAYRSILNAAGLGTDLISVNLYGQNAKLKIEEKSEIVSKRIKSLNFRDNPDATLYTINPIHESVTNPIEFTFEGSFIFPKPSHLESHKILTSSVFGLDDSTGYSLRAEKENYFSDSAKFILSSSNSNLSPWPEFETSKFFNVYDSNPWHFAMTLFKDTDDTFFDNTESNYKIAFLGHKCLSGEVLESFHLTAALTSQQYESLSKAEKNPFLGAKRTNQTGEVTSQTDIKALNFSAWNTALTKEEVETNAMTLSSYGVADYILKDSLGATNVLNKTRGEKQLFKIQFDSFDKVPSTPVDVPDMLSGSAGRIAALGSSLGSSYDFRTFGFSESLEESVQVEFIPAIEKLPLSNLVVNRGVEIKEKEIDKFDLKTKPQRKIISFEKSMYRMISKEMLLFLSSLSNFNNLIGEPVNKYRKSYKSLDNLRQRFFSIVEETSQVEKFISYYRWIDKVVGHFLKQITPASLEINSGIENVIESHLFERPKINHKLARIKNYTNLTDTITSIHGFTANSYSWPEGHHSDDENENDTYDRMRKAVDPARSGIRDVSVGIRNNVGSQYANFSKFANESLTKVYGVSSELAGFFKAGSHSGTSTLEGLDFYKRLSSGEGIFITQDAFAEPMGKDVGKNMKVSVQTNIGSLDSGEITYSKSSLPFDFVSDSTANDLGTFKAGIQITNSTYKPEALQGPWVRQNVGSYAHRNVALGTDSADRPEAYNITHDTTDNVLIIKSPEGQMSMVRRDPVSAPYNIRNIKSDPTTGQVGNYNNPYETVQVVGVEAVSNLAKTKLKEELKSSTHVEGMVDYPVLHGLGKQSNVFVSTFSSSGRSSNFGKDLNTGEMSVYNSMNYRNLLVRNVLDCIYAESSGPNGTKSTLGSKGQVLGSWHKTPKNPTYRTTAEGNKVVYDNFFVQSHLPQTDFSYSWINKSTNEDVYSFLAKNSNAGHQSTFVSPTTNESKESIEFLKTKTEESDLDFIGLNYVNPKSIDEQTNTLTNESTDLNTILLNNGGSPGWPSWKQIRNSYNPIVRLEKKKNIISVTFRGDKPNARKHPASKFDYKNTKEEKDQKKVSRQIKRFEEVPVTSRFSPLKLTIGPENTEISNYNQTNTLTYQQAEFFKWRSQSMDNYNLEYVGPKKVTVNVSPQNSISGFANEELSEMINFRERPIEETEGFQSLNYFAQLMSEQSPGSLGSSVISYKEKIYPKETNTYKKKVRNRLNFDYFAWKSSRSERQMTLGDNITYGSYFFTGVNLLPSTTIIEKEENYKKSYFNQYDAVDLDSLNSSNSLTNLTPITHSVWPLDSRSNFSSLPCEITNTYFSAPSTFMSSRSQGTFGEGLLQNDYSLFPLGINVLHGAPPIAPVYNRRIPFAHNGSTYLAGEAKWQAAEGRTLGPFYDTYDKFSENSRIIGKTYSLIPEFRVSKFVEKLLSQPDLKNLTKDIDNFLEIEGAESGISSGDLNLGGQFFKTYSNSDFLKYFNIVQDNSKLKEVGFSQGSLTLRCKAVKKFLPYRGFYPAERIAELANIFNKNYLPETSYDLELLDDTMFASNDDEAKLLLSARIQNSKNQIIKPLMAPGVLLNSIKAGLAVDYPIFSSNPTAALNVIYQATDDTNLAMFTDLSSIGADASLPFKGSAINSSTDTGAPRISGNVSTRISFDDILNPENLYSTVFHDNEPHPAATTLYGSNLHFTILERPATFGLLDKEKTIKYSGIKFENTRETFEESIRPFKSAVNNFAFETVNFFLENSKLTSFVSDPVKPKLKKGVQYKMTVHLDNRKTMMYDRHSAFGPPVDEGTLNIRSYTVSSNSTNAAAAKANVDFTGKTPGNLADETVTLVDYNDESKTYVFKQDISAVPAESATGYVQVDSITLTNTTFTLEDAESSSNTKTYQVETAAAAAANNGHASFVLNEPGTAKGMGEDSNFAGVSNYPYLTITDKSSTSLTLRFYDSNSSYMTNTSSASGVTYINLYDASLSAYRSKSQLISECKSEIESALDISVTEPSTGTMKLALGSSGSFSTAGLTSGNCFYDSQSSPCTGGQHITTDTTLPQFAGNSPGYPASGELVGNNVAININGMDLAATLAEMRSVIISSAGHNGTISVTVDTSTNRINLTQSTTGISGNNTITKSGSYSGNLTIDGFSDGVDAVSGTNYTTGDLLGSDIIVDVTSLSSLSDLSAALVTAISSSNGHNGSIIQEGTFDNSTDVLTLKQNSSGTDGNKTNSSTINSFISNFIDGAASSTATEKTLTEQSTSTADSHGFLPFVPPFLDPDTSPYVEISFTPSETAEYTIPEIIDGCTKTFYNVEAPSNSNSNCNYTNAMNLEASLDLDGFVSYQSEQDSAENDKFRWVIQTKWETPVLNFKNKKTSAINLSTNQVEELTGSPWKERHQSDYYNLQPASTHFPSSKGMWHQNGDLPPENSDNGYFLSISGPEESQSTPNVKSLSKILGFTPTGSSKERSTSASKFKEARLGKLPEKKVVFESVIAIPYYLNEAGEISLMEPSSTASNWYSKQLALMDKYVIPPHFDFTRNSNVKPHIQYIFEFKAELSKQDLADIWQNLYPENTDLAIARKSNIFPTSSDKKVMDSEFASTSINNVSSADYKNPEIFQKEKVRWIIFKSKFRGGHRFENLKLSSIPGGSILDTSISVDDTTGNRVTDFVYENYGFNWPYDYFSIVELVEVSAKVDFTPRGPGISTSTLTSASMSDIDDSCGDVTTSTRETPVARITAATTDTIINNNYITVEGASTSGSITETELTQLLKATDAAVPSPANQVVIPLPNGYSLKSGSESIYINGVLQTEGSNNDYTISTGIITLAFDLVSSDNLTIKYKLQESSC